MSVKINFFGVRGSCPRPYKEFMEYGGATSCIEIVNDKGERLIIDGGMGVHKLGDELVKKDEIDNINFLFTHYHLDHTSGMPFFNPFYNEKANINVYASLDALEISLTEVFKRIFSSPLFPVEFDKLPSRVKLNNFKGYDEFQINSYKIKPYPLKHPGGSCGYRISCEGKIIAIVFDTYHDVEKMDENALKLMENADIVIYDANYCDEEYEQFKHFGHSTWQEGLRLVKHSGAKKYVIFHHHQARTDEEMKKLEEKALKSYNDVVVAKEGMEIVI